MNTSLSHHRFVLVVAYLLFAALAATVLRGVMRKGIHIPDTH